MARRFVDRDHTKCSSQDGNFKPRQTVLKSCGKQTARRNKNPLAVGVTLLNHDMLPGTFFGAASSIAQI